MDGHPTLPLVDRLQVVAAIWTEANDATLARLGRQVVNDGGFFTRLESPSASTTTATLEKFARFLADGASWPDGVVPEEAVAFAHVTGVSAAAVGPSAGNTAGVSPSAKAAA